MGVGVGMPGAAEKSTTPGSPNHQSIFKMADGPLTIEMGRMIPYRLPWRKMSMPPKHKDSCVPNTTEWTVTYGKVAALVT